MKEIIDKHWAAKPVDLEAYSRFASKGDPESKTSTCERPVRIDIRKGDGLREIGDILPLGLTNYLRLLMRNQPLLRSDWQTMDFYQELTVRFLSSLARHAFLDLPKDHRAALILRMARQVGKDQLKKVQRKKRDCRRVEHGEAKLAQVKYLGDPSEDLICAEAVTKVRGILSLRDWTLLEMYNQGHSWREIAKELGGTPGSQRMRHLRLARRLAHHFI